MDLRDVSLYSEKLHHRKEEIERTLRYLENERREVEDNTEWLDRAAYENRASLLNELSLWYRTEMQEVENALGRIKRNRYGLCSACHEPIKPSALKLVRKRNFASNVKPFARG